MGIRNNFKHTQNACYLGLVTQAVVNNFAPLLFLTFQNTYHISLDKIALLITINFGIQLMVDLLAVKVVDRIGYRICAVAGHVFAALGLVGLSILPGLFADAYYGLLLSVFLYAFGGGLLEVLISPIMEACPTEHKSKAMSLLHSFYCWGHVAVVLLSTLFFTLAGQANWQILACLWAAVPLMNALYFSLVPINTLVEEENKIPVRKILTGKWFWVFALLIFCSGAAEQSMSQWASAFAEMGLKVSKTMGDLAGPCLFAVLMGLSRTFYAKFGEKIDLHKFIAASGILCIASYLIAVFSPWPLLSLAGCGLCGLSVGIFWPGTYSIAAHSHPAGGTAMFALLAFAGDVGCSLGPTLVGFVSNAMGGELKAGLLAAVVFPLLLVIGVRYSKRVKA